MHTSVVKLTAVVLALALALLPAGLARTALAAPAAAGQHLPFNGTFQAAENNVVDPGPPFSVAITGNGSGNATLLGQFTDSYHVVLHLDAQGFGVGTIYYDFVAATGEHLYSVGDGVGSEGGHVVETHTVTGGTGRFDGATGRFTIDRVVNIENFTTAGTIAGYIVLPQRVERTTAGFTIPAGQCPNLPAGVSVTGSGSRVTTTDLTVRADTTSYLTINDVVQGTATGSNGQAYTFYYANTSTWDEALTGPVQVKMYDLFLLQTDALAASNSYALRSGFTWRWSFTPPAGPFDVWPPANFQPSATFGQPLNADASPRCDPL